MAPTSSARWCPTPEQLMILEEMYRSGIRTPNATQIQQITSHLSFYGKIEGKNVFYWFQNHKARDRQKLRRKLLAKQLQLQHQLYHHRLPPPPPPPAAAAAAAASHPFLHFFDSSSHPAASPPAFQPLHQYYNSPVPTLLPQMVGIHPEDAAASASAKQVMNYTWKFDQIPERSCSSSVDIMDKAMMRMYGGDWMMMVDLGPPLSSSPCYSTRPPLKTLELFPVTASNLKEDCNSNNNNNNTKTEDNKSPNNLSTCLGAPNNPTSAKPILALS